MKRVNGGWQRNQTNYTSQYNQSTLTNREGECAQRVKRGNRPLNEPAQPNSPGQPQRGGYSQRGTGSGGVPCAGGHNAVSACAGSPVLTVRTPA